MDSEGSWADGRRGGGLKEGDWHSLVLAVRELFGSSAMCAWSWEYGVWTETGDPQHLKYHMVSLWSHHSSDGSHERERVREREREREGLREWEHPGCVRLERSWERQTQGSWSWHKCRGGREEAQISRRLSVVCLHSSGDAFLDLKTPKVKRTEVLWRCAHITVKHSRVWKRLQCFWRFKVTVTRNIKV